MIGRRLARPYLAHHRAGASDHIVEADGGLVRCHCPDSERVGDGCKHNLALRLRAGDDEVIDALRQLIPAPPAGQSRPRRAFTGDRGEYPTS